MKICATCQKPVADQNRTCTYCQMQMGPYGIQYYGKEYLSNPRWTLFPPVPKTHWWGIEFDSNSTVLRRELGSVVSNGAGKFASGPELKLGIGLYEFRCLLSVDRIPRGRQIPLGVVRVLRGDSIIAERLLKGEDFEAGSKEASINVGFKLENSGEDVRCEFSNNGIVSLGLIWVRLVPRFGWQWEGKNLNYDEKALVSVNDQGVTLKPYLDNDDPELWGPYIYLPSGFYQLLVCVSAHSSESPLIASWQVFSIGRELLSKIPIDLDFSPYNQPQTVSRNFYLEEGFREVEFRIFVELGQITVHWLRLIPPEGHIWERYYELGGRESMLGLPVSSEGRAGSSVIGTKGRYRRFESGTIYFSNSNYQAREVWGTISSLYEKLGGTSAHGIGFPAGYVQPVKSSFGTIGEFQRFEGWGEPAIFAYPNDRAKVCAIYGSISSKYWEMGGPNGSLGFPTSENEYDWLKEDMAFRRSDFEGGYIVWKDNASVVHLSPKPQVYVEYPPSISLGDDLTIVVTGELEQVPIKGAWCTISFPDQFEIGSITIEGGPQGLRVEWPGTKSWGNYGKCSDYVLQYPRVEMWRWQENWLIAPTNSYQIRVRPTRPGRFRIFARMTAQDEFDPNVWGYDPHPELPGVIRDQQDEAVYVHVVEVQVGEYGTDVIHEDRLPSTRKHFFVSYNKADRLWAEWIAWQLEAAGYSTVLQAWDFRPGSNFVLEMDKAATEAERTIAILSPNYLNALYTQPEWSAAFRRDPTGEKGYLLPVRVQESELPGLLGSLVYIDLVGMEESTARERLLKGLRYGRNKPTTPPSFPGSLPKAPRFPGT